MSDGFEFQYFGTPTGNDPNADADRDGFTNLQEFIAGTSPTDATSRFAISSVQRLVNGFSVAWNAVPGRSYRVWSSANPMDGFVPLTGPMTASSTSMQHLDATAATRRFYKVEVLPPPE